MSARRRLRAKSVLPQVKSGKINEECYATIGQVGNTEHENVILGKPDALGIAVIAHHARVAAIRLDHPNGGGQGKSKVAAAGNNGFAVGFLSLKAARPRQI